MVGLLGVATGSHILTDHNQCTSKVLKMRPYLSVPSGAVFIAEVDLQPCPPYAREGDELQH